MLGLLRPEKNEFSKIEREFSLKGRDEDGNEGGRRDIYIG